jgi:hypothetical protein
MIRIEKNNQLLNDHCLYIKPILINRITIIIRNKYIGRDPSKIYLNSQELKILAFLNNPLIIEKLLNSNDLIRIIKIIRKRYPDLCNKKKSINKVLYNIFVDHGYNKGMDMNYKFNFIDKIGLRSCPYCNRSYIYTLNKSKELKPEIDHFYPKDKYPFLAVSFFNLIPSCPTCNGLSAKSNIDSYSVRLKNPYLIKDDDFKFDIHIKNISINNPLSNIDLNSVSVYFRKRIKSHLKTFGLELLYKEHRDIAIELYYKSKLEYSKKYREYIKSYGIKFSDDEINRFILGNYSKIVDYHKRPLSKFMKEIAEKFGLM